MSVTTGTTIQCDGPGSPRDRFGCTRDVFGLTPEDARERATERGFTQVEDGRDFCADCSELRAARKKPAELVPAGVRVMEVFEAADAAGFERRDFDEATGTAHFYCCGVEVTVHHLIGAPYAAECKTCGNFIAMVPGPSFGNSWVSIPDSTKVDTEDPRAWYVGRELEAALAKAEGGAP